MTLEEVEKAQKGCLYIVSLPIGHKKDITLRALEILKTVDIILAEDTRVLLRLLEFYKIFRERIYSFYSYNELEKIPQVLKFLKSSCSVALVSDAGTPLINDPGHLLIKTLLEHQIPIACVPGPSAITASLPLSGFPLEHFFFAGFLSSKIGKKKNQINHLKNMQTVIVVYEASHRIKETLQIFEEIFENVPVFLARELTKIHESFYRGSLSDIYAQTFSKNFICKGEFVIIVNNRKHGSSDSVKDSG